MERMPMPSWRQVTYEVKDVEDELAVLSSAMKALGDGDMVRLSQILQSRMDALLTPSHLKDYDPREEAQRCER